MAFGWLVWAGTHPTWVIGHRGLGQKHAPEPENSILALTTAFRKGVTAVEFDVQLTSDGEAVLAHDPRLERMTNGSGCVARHSLAELRELRLKDSRGFVHEELAPATLREALESIRGFDSPERPFLADIHIKVYDGLKGDVTGTGTFTCPRTRFGALTDSVLRIVREEGLLERVIFTSFDRRVLERIRAELPAQRVGLLTYLGPAHALSYAHSGHYDFVALNQGHFEPWHIRRAHELGLGVLIWSPSGPGALSYEAAVGADAWITDNVPEAVQLAQ
jgi:glycerophosphoryl diester phosphodiesterase